MVLISDIELVKRVQAGEIPAYEELVNRYEAKLLRFLRRYTKEESIAEEVVQDALFKIYKNINRIDERKGFAGYLYAVTRNEMMTRFRKEKLVLPLFDDTVGVSGEDLYEEIDKKDKQNMVRKAMGELKEKQRRIIELYFFEELSYKRIGELLGVPLNTIKTNLRRAKSALLKRIKNEKS